MRHHVWQAVHKLIALYFGGNVVRVLENKIRVSCEYSIFLRLHTYCNVFYFSGRVCSRIGRNPLVRRVRIDRHHGSHLNNAVVAYMPFDSD